MTTTRSTTTTVPRRQGQCPAGLPAPGRRAGSTYAPPRRRGGAQQAGGRPPARGALPTSRTASAGPGTGPGSGTWQAGGSERYGAPTGVILEGRAGVDLVRTGPVSDDLPDRERAARPSSRGVPRDDNRAVVGDPHRPHLAGAVRVDLVFRPGRRRCRYGFTACWRRRPSSFSASAALFTAPGQAAPLWPWKLTPLLAQATAAWMISMGVARGAGAAGAGHVPPASRRTGSAQQSPLDHPRHLHVRPAGATSWRPVA